MAKVITFSRTFPAYHPRKGEPTYFVEKFWNSIPKLDFELIGSLNKNISEKDFNVFIESLTRNINIKKHTIRAGHRFKAGDFFSPRVWGNDINHKSGKSGPYNSKQIIIGPDIEIQKIWDIEIIQGEHFFVVKIEGYKKGASDVEILSINDGLELRDFFDWFELNLPFKGQIICWNEDINY